MAFRAPLGFPLERRVSVMLVTMLIAAVMGISAISIRQPQRILHCSHIAAKQTMSTERGSA